MIDECAASAGRSELLLNFLSAVAPRGAAVTLLTMRYEACSDLEIESQRPLQLAAGDAVQVGKRDTTWPGWRWVTAADGESAWMHESMLELSSETAAVATEAYLARELSVRKGEVVESLRELGGWHWCRKVDGSDGWIPAYNLRPVSGDTPGTA